jgi:hypothetical protein
MSESIRVEMGIQRFMRVGWKYLKIASDWLYPVLLIIMGLFIFTAPATVDDSIDLTKRQLMGCLAITLALLRLPRKGKVKL